MHARTDDDGNESDDWSLPPSKRPAHEAASRNMLLQWRNQFSNTTSVTEAMAQSNTGQFALRVLSEMGDTNMQAKVLLVSAYNGDHLNVKVFWDKLKHKPFALNWYPVPGNPDRAVRTIFECNLPELMDMFINSMMEQRTIATNDELINDALMAAVGCIMDKVACLTGRQLDERYDVPDLGRLKAVVPQYLQIVQLAAETGCFSYAAGQTFYKDSRRLYFHETHFFREAHAYFEPVRWIVRGVHTEYIKAICQSRVFVSNHGALVVVMLDALFDRMHAWQDYEALVVDLQDEFMNRSAYKLTDRDASEANPGNDVFRFRRTPLVAWSAKGADTMCEFPILLGAPIRAMHGWGTERVMNDEIVEFFYTLLQIGQWKVEEKIALLEEVVHLQLFEIAEIIVKNLSTTSQQNNVPLPTLLTHVSTKNASLLTRVCNNHNKRLFPLILHMCNWSPDVYGEALTMALSREDPNQVRSLLDTMTRLNVSIPLGVPRFIKSDFEYPMAESDEEPRRPFLTFVAEHATSLFEEILESPAADWPLIAKEDALHNLIRMDIANTTEFNHNERFLNRLDLRLPCAPILHDEDATKERYINRLKMNRSARITLRKCITHLLVPPHNIPSSLFYEWSEEHKLVNELSEVAFRPGGIGFLAAAESFHAPSA